MSVSLSDAKSAELYARAVERLPGGVNSPVRAMRAIGRDPIFIDRALGAEIIDVDGNRYVDFVCSWGPLIHGHAHPAILDAVHAAAVTASTTRGCAWPAIRGPHEHIQSISTLPSASLISAPLPLCTNTGSRPIEPIARTGEFTPPGRRPSARP